MTGHSKWNTGSKPISPAEAEIAQTHCIPDPVIVAVNQMLAEQGSCSKITLYQDEVMERVLQHMPGVTRQEVFKRKWLDFENVFIAAGWGVVYDKPGYCENYEAHWIFTK